MAKTNYDLKRIRTGKTAKDRKSGAFERNQANKMARVTWQHAVLSTGGKTIQAFPKDSCNGKKNRYII